MIFGTHVQRSESRKNEMSECEVSQSLEKRPLPTDVTADELQVHEFGDGKVEKSVRDE